MPAFSQQSLIFLNNSPVIGQKSPKLHLHSNILLQLHSTILLNPTFHQRRMSTWGARDRKAIVCRSVLQCVEVCCTWLMCQSTSLTQEPLIWAQVLWCFLTGHFWDAVHNIVMMCVYHIAIMCVCSIAITQYVILRLSALYNIVMMCVNNTAILCVYYIAITQYVILWLRALNSIVMMCVHYLRLRAYIILRLRSISYCDYAVCDIVVMCFI